MNKFALLLFTSLTLGATYLTAYDIGVQETKAYYGNTSVRSNSIGNHTYGGGK